MVSFGLSLFRPVTQHLTRKPSLTLAASSHLDMNSRRIAINSLVSIGDYGSENYSEALIPETEDGPFAPKLVKCMNGTENWVQLNLLEEPLVR